MNNPNPYQAPEATLQATSEEDDGLASRASRFWAVIIDALIGMVIAVPVFLYFDLLSFVMSGREPPLGLLLGSTAAGLVGFLLVHGWLLHTSAQTVGKRLLGIRIVDLEGRNASLAQIFFMRHLPVTLVSLIPAGGFIVLIDALLIFKKDRRCLHDIVAGTRVVKA
ncbi:MAG: hypothetical protein K0R03_254 [Moraxellaceae bacterium]|jgi:uncharacterized RDD family membrane protein YckC|nr:hypothetical protein [Moraxellaceae bacterium]MDF3029696.1 hypothetical protein [Moraxellaceae bacterium]